MLIYTVHYTTNNITQEKHMGTIGNLAPKMSTLRCPRMFSYTRFSLIVCYKDVKKIRNFYLNNVSLKITISENRV